MQRQWGSASEALKREWIDLYSEKKVSWDASNNDSVVIVHCTFFDKFKTVVSSRLFKKTILGLFIILVIALLLVVLQANNMLSSYKKRGLYNSIQKHCKENTYYGISSSRCVKGLKFLCQRSWGSIQSVCWSNCNKNWACFDSCNPRYQYCEW